MIPFEASAFLSTIEVVLFGKMNSYPPGLYSPTFLKYSKYSRNAMIDFSTLSFSSAICALRTSLSFSRENFLLMSKTLSLLGKLKRCKYLSKSSLSSLS